ncbi:deoxynucleoside kinase [Drosophila suzukii associated hytrosavirus 1]|nr:deoxynucleoside kinase [Drosophila suzukii associated hytrosavirus 1]
MESFHEREIKSHHEICIFERSLYSSLNVFASLNCTDEEVNTLRDEYDNLGVKNARRYYIYLRSSAAQCYENINKRRKTTDSYIDIDYLKVLERKHDSLFMPVFMSPIDTYVVDGSQKEDDVLVSVLTVINDIMNKENKFIY